MPPLARYKDGRLVVEGKGMDALAERGFGSRRDGRLILEPWEALYLLEKGKLRVVDEDGRELGFQELLAELRRVDEATWARYLIYRDLRERGYVVKRGFGPEITFRLYGRGEYGRKEARYVVFGLLEGSPVRLSVLEELLRRAQAVKKELILAVVDRRGEVVYYSLSSWPKQALEREQEGG